MNLALYNTLYFTVVSKHDVHRVNSSHNKAKICTTFPIKYLHKIAQFESTGTITSETSTYNNNSLKQMTIAKPNRNSTQHVPFIVS